MGRRKRRAVPGIRRGEFHHRSDAAGGWRGERAAGVVLLPLPVLTGERRRELIQRGTLVIRQIVPLPSSEIKSAPSLATAIPTGRPQTSVSLTTKPVTKSSYSPVGLPSFILMRITL